MPLRCNSIVPGKRFGRWTIVARDPSGTSRHGRFQVRCDCGTKAVVAAGSLTKTGGCKACAIIGKRPKYGQVSVVGTKIYLAWISMRRRCYALDDPRSARWGARGIRVCKEWDESFEVFRDWSLAHGFRDGLSLDRVDSDGNYEPSNCEWVTRSVNSKRCRASYVFARRELIAWDHLPIEALWGNG